MLCDSDKSYTVNGLIFFNLGGLEDMFMSHRVVWTLFKHSKWNGHKLKGQVNLGHVHHQFLS